MLISVVIPVYNMQDTILHSIRSLQTQTLPPDEILLIDNGSNGTNATLLQRLANEDCRIRIFTLAKPNIVDALNVGLEKAQGRFIARMDADDICLPHRFEKQIQFFQDNPEIGLLGTFTFAVNDHQSDPSYIVPVPTDHASIFRQLRFPYPAGHFLHPTIMFCPERIIGNIRYRHGFRYAEDFDLWLRLSRRCKMANFPEPLLRYTLPNSSSFRRRYPYIPFRSCLVSLAEDRLQINSPESMGKGICNYLNIFKGNDLFTYSTTLIGYAIYKKLQLKLLIRCYKLISLHGGSSMAQQCLETVFPFINYNDENYKYLHDFFHTIGFHPFTNYSHEYHQYLQECIRILASTQNWNEADIKQFNSYTNIGQLLNSPAPVRQSAINNILSIFNIIQYTIHRLDRLFDLNTREGCLGFLGFFFRWIRPNLPISKIPNWQIKKLASIRTIDTQAGPLALSALQEAMWLSDTTFDINTALGQKYFFDWMDQDPKFIELESEITGKIM
jgi:glycosyltransferase involved in cell wall biosynthesis